MVQDKEEKEDPTNNGDDEKNEREGEMEMVKKCRLSVTCCLTQKAERNRKIQKMKKKQMRINKTILSSSIESRVCIELASVWFDGSHLAPRKKNIWQTIAHTEGTSCIPICEILQ